MTEITKPGIYRTRNNRIAIVSDIVNSSTWEESLREIASRTF